MHRSSRPAAAAIRRLRRAAGDAGWVAGARWQKGRTRLDTDGRLEPPFSRGYTDFCPNLPPLTDTSAWPQISFAADALASTLPDLHAWGTAIGEGSVLAPALHRDQIEGERGVAVQRDAAGRLVSFRSTARWSGPQAR